MLSDLTNDEIRTILSWSMEAADKARKSISYWPEPYQKAQAIHDKVHDEYYKRKTEQ